MFMAKVMGYELKEGEEAFLQFTPIEQCPIVGQYIIRPMIKFELPAEAKKQGEPLKFIPVSECPSNEYYLFRPMIRSAS